MDITVTGKTAYSILISHGDAPQNAVPPPAVADNIAAFLKVHPDWTHTLLNAPQIEAIIRDNFEPSVLDAYDSFTPYAYKADLARYCLIYLYGGIYFDLSVRLTEPIPIMPDKITVFRDMLGSVSYELYNGAFYAPARHPALRAAIDACVRNAQTEYYGINASCPTGPVLFGKALAQHAEPEEQYIGEAMPYRNERELYLVHSGCPYKVIGYRRKEGAGISSLGVSTGNDFQRIWDSGSVYGFSKPRRFDAKRLVQQGFLAGSTAEGGDTIARPDYKGVLITGPRVYLTPGRHTVTFEVDRMERPADWTLHVTSQEAGFSDTVAFQDEASIEGGLLTHSFDVEQVAHDYEFTFHGPADKPFVLRAVTLQQDNGAGQGNKRPGLLRRLMTLKQTG